MNWKSRDEEKRRLRTRVAMQEQTITRYKAARAEIEKENKELKEKCNRLKKEMRELERRSDELRRQRDRYRDMVFKPNNKPENQKDEREESKIVEPKRKRGGQKGHKGYGRKRPNKVDEVKRVYLEKCPICENKLKRTEEINPHTIEDIPSPEILKPRVIRYETEKQWCSNCKKKVKAIPEGVIPGSQFGINLILYVMLQKYGAKSSWDSIIFDLITLFGIKVSKAGLVGMLHRTRKWLGVEYEQILEEIRGSPVKHADETGWRVNGENHWLWGFFTKRGAYYSIEESRGKGVAEKHLEGSHEEDVLVRDDYAGYKKLKLKHQSCWPHLLRKSHEAANDVKASEEVKEMHKNLKKIFYELSTIIDEPYEEIRRKEAHDRFKKKIDEIVASKYRDKETKKIQTRINNQTTNLITALLYDGVPLTNNLAERSLRPMVVTRKISGGSRSWEGAKTHAVNMSIFQTIRMQQQPLLATLKHYLLSALPKD